MIAISRRPCQEAEEPGGGDRRYAEHDRCPSDPLRQATVLDHGDAQREQERGHPDRERDEEVVVDGVQGRGHDRIDIVHVGDQGEVERRTDSDTRHGHDQRREVDVRKNPVRVRGAEDLPYPSREEQQQNAGSAKQEGRELVLALIVLPVLGDLLC